MTMGGKKRLSLRQIEKMQDRKSGKRRSGTSGGRTDKKPKIFMPNPNSKVLSTLKKEKVLTPYTVASLFNLRLSIAKQFLGDLENRGIVEYVSGSRKLRIYKPVNQ